MSLIHLEQGVVRTSKTRTLLLGQLRGGWSSILIFIYYMLFINAQVIAQVKSFGLEGKTVSSISFTPQMNYSTLPRFIYAGTDQDGIFERDITSPDSGWVNRGLRDKTITAVHVYHWGVGPMELNTILVGIEPSDLAGDTTLLYILTDGLDSVWVPFDNGLDTLSSNRIYDIQGFFYRGHEPPQPLFVSTGYSFFRSYGWDSWEVISPTGIGLINTIKLDQNPLYWFGGDIWIGGETGYFTPYLSKSSDYGSTWEIFYPSLDGDNACYSIAIHPEQSNIIYAGMEGSVIKTTDGGQTWNATSLQGLPVSFYGLVINPINPDQLVAGGVISPYGIALYETFDGGINWTEIIANDTTAGISCLVSDTTNDEFVVYGGTFGDGVIRYTSDLISVQENENTEIPLNYKLCKNYPNPFNPTTNIQYELPQKSDVQISIYDLLGRKVTTLVSEKQDAGKKTVTWNATNDQGKPVSAGVYLYQIRAGEYMQTKKMVLLK